MTKQYLRPTIGIILIAWFLYLGESTPTQAEIRMLAVGAVLAVGVLCFGDVEFVKYSKTTIQDDFDKMLGTFRHGDHIESSVSFMIDRGGNIVLSPGVERGDSEIEICVTEAKPQ